MIDLWELGQLLGIVLTACGLLYHWSRKKKDIEDAAVARNNIIRDIDSHGERLAALEKADDDFQKCVRKELHEISNRLAVIETKISASHGK